VRLRALGSTLFCMLIVVGNLASATAATGGVSAGRAPSASRTPPQRGPLAPTAKKRHTAPVTSHSTSLAYNGPVYEKAPSGQLVPYQPPEAPGEVRATTGGSAVGIIAAAKPDLLVPGHIARVVNGLAAAPISAPPAVQEIVWAGNQITGLPYIFGGGHASFVSPGYDCSGTVSFALHGANLLSTPEDSSEFMAFGSHGVGTWVTIFTNPGHAYMTVAGLRLDTSAADDPTNQQGPRWRPLRPVNSGYTVRHPTSL
jgi:cell wall-associated NlpC family hydrolase